MRPLGDLVTRFGRSADRLVDTRWTVPLVALAAFLLRLPGLRAPLRPDEAGFLLVARAWDPQPDSMFGTYFVDRPPLLIGVIKAADALAGPMLLRVLGVLACVLVVLAAAAAAGLVADRRTGRWVAVVVAAMTSNAAINLVAVKGELLALPFIMGSVWLALLAVRRSSAATAAAAGLVGCTAIGFKQNLAGGLVFAAALLVTSWATRQISAATFWRLTGAGLAGALVPIAATIGWALSAGVGLDTLWQTIYGFRSEASSVLAAYTSSASDGRRITVVVVALSVGMLLIVVGFLAHIRDEWRTDPAVTAATATLLLFDLAGLVLGGSYWRDYLFPLIPATALCAAMLTRRTSKRGLTIRVVIIAAVASTIISVSTWVLFNLTGSQEYDEAALGRAIKAAAAPGDSLVVFGGRADIQYYSGLPSPYQHLWSLPMRTLDPELSELTGLVEGPHPPTWLVEWVPFGSWKMSGGAGLSDAVQQRYDLHDSSCRGRPVFLLRGADRAGLDPTCKG